MHSRTLNAIQSQCLRCTQAENSAMTYTVNWAALLDTETVSTSTWTAEDSGLTIANEANTTQETSARLSGDPGRYRATNKVVTSSGDTHERYIDLTILDNDAGYTDDYGFTG